MLCTLIYNKYKKQLNKLKKYLGMIGPKSTQTRVVGIIMDEMHPYIQFSSNGVSMKNV